MSSVRLTENGPRGKKDQVISVPLGVGQALVAEGAAVYPTAAVPLQVAKVAAPSAADRHAAEIARLNALHAATLSDFREESDAAAKKVEKEHAAELAKIQAEFEAANKTIAELNAKQTAGTKK